MKSLPEIQALLAEGPLLAVSTPAVYRKVLVEGGVPNELREFLKGSRERDGEMRAFVDGMMGDFQKGVNFRHEAFLAALAIACESLASPFAEDYLEGLAKLNFSEIPMASRIARIARDSKDVRTVQLDAPKNPRVIVEMPSRGSSIYRSYSSGDFLEEDWGNSYEVRALEMAKYAS